MIQSALCFQSKPGKHEKSSLQQTDDKVRHFSTSILNDSRSSSRFDRKSLSRRWQRRQIPHQAKETGGGQEDHPSSTATAAAEEAPGRSFTLLKSASKRLSKSITFTHSSRRAKSKPEVAGDSVPEVGVRKKKAQAVSILKLVRKRSGDDRSTAAQSTDDNQPLHPFGRSASLRIDSSWSFGKGDEKNLALLLAPVSLAASDMQDLLEAGQKDAPLHHQLNLDVPIQPRNPPEKGFLENAQAYLESDFSVQTPSLPIAAWADAKGALQSVATPPQSDPVLEHSPGGDHVSPNCQDFGLGKVVEAKRGDEVVELVPISRAIEMWHKKKRQIRSLVDISGGRAAMKEGEEMACEHSEGMSVQTSANPQRDSLSETKLGTENCSASTQEESHGHGILMPLEPSSERDSTVHIRARTPSCVDDCEAVEQLWKESGPMDGVLPATQRKPPAAADCTSRRERSRKVRFKDCPSEQENGLSVVDRGVDASSTGVFQDHHSATLLGKLRTTRHHQVHFLQDELEKTRTLASELEVECEAQREMKLAFKAQAVQLGNALKKLRDLTQENGFDPRGAEGQDSAPVDSNGTTTAASEASQASENEHGTKEINSSPELNLLKAQAIQFGWLCDPKEVELREQIGTGSTADIFKGSWQNLEVAVKCLRPDIFRDNNMVAVRAFSREVELLSRQRHPFILRMFAACLSLPHHAWIITEYASLGTLTEWLHGTKTRQRNRRAPLPSLSERLRIATEISIAMQHLHELSPKTLHRDLKPSNIFLDENKHVRIADFNCARCVSSEDAVLTGGTGTYVYMAPEVMSHQLYDEKCDVYSFAVILSELLTGNFPYIDTRYSPAEIACKVAQGTLRPTIRENQPQELVQLITGAWDQEPANRPSFSNITAKLKVMSRNLSTS